MEDLLTLANDRESIKQKPMAARAILLPTLGNFAIAITPTWEANSSTSFRIRYVCI